MKYTDSQIEDILRTMRNFGGDFVRALVVAYRCADRVNKMKLYTAFETYFDSYYKRFVQS